MSLDPDDPTPDGDSDDVGGGQTGIGAIGAVAAAAYPKTDKTYLPWQTPKFQPPPATITTTDGSGNPITLTLVSSAFNTTGSEAGTQQYVAYATPDKSQIIIGVQGTWNGTNLGVDLGTWSKSSPNPSAGFLNYLTDAANFVASVESANPGATLSITGHSLGGSVAQVIGYYMNLAATAIYAPGVGGFITGPAVSTILTPHIPAGYTPATDDVVNTDIHRPGELLSGAGTPFGTQFVIQSTDPNSIINKGNHWYSNDHSLDDVLPILNSAGVAGSGVTIVPLTTPTDPYLNMPVNLIPDSNATGTGSDFNGPVISGQLGIADPPPGGRFVLTFGAGSAPMDKLLLPDDGQGLASFKVRIETGGAWSPIVSYALGTPITVPLGAQAIQIEAFDGSGQIVTLVSNWEFYATFLGSGTFKASVVASNDAISDYASTIQTDYDLYFGRDPAKTELAYWTSVIGDAGDVATLRAALLSDPAGRAHTASEVTSLYDTYFGRDPTAGEISVWNGLIAGGADFTTLRSALLSAPAGQAHTTAQITHLYDTYFGRDPTAGELSVWSGLIAGGADFVALRAALLADPGGQTAAQIISLYDTYFGRDPSDAEIIVWQASIAKSHATNGLRAALLGDPAGQAHTASQITALYDTYFGRDPSAAELNVWKGLIAGGSDFTTLRTALLNDPAGHAHTSAQITSLYDTYFGRDPQPSELAIWQGLVAGGADFNALRAALLGDPSGQAHTNAEITLLYDTYFGRDPQASELATWQGLVAGGQDFNGLRVALLNDPAGQAHSNSEIKSLYDTYFGRDPTAAEVAAWKGALAGGDDFYQVQDTLERLSTTVAQIHATPKVKAYIYGPNPNLVIDAFDATVDNLNLSKAQFGAINPLDATHARQIQALDGTTDVLITLDASHSILFEHTQLASLHASNLLFG